MLPAPAEKKQRRCPQRTDAQSGTKEIIYSDIILQFVRFVKEVAVKMAVSVDENDDKEDRKSSQSFYAVIPAKVLMDKGLRPNAKLLYAKISNFCNLKGYCWASNEQLAEGLNIVAKTVSSLVSQLSSKNLIRVRVIRDPKTNEIIERRIWLLMPEIRIEEVQTPMPNNEHTLPPNLSIPIPKNVEENNLSDRSNIPPKAPQGGRRKKREAKAAPDWKPERFAGFWEYYRTHCRGESKQAAIRAWDRLKPDDDLIAKIGRALQKQIQSPDWQAGIGIPYASTWLNNARWEDEPKTADRNRPDDGQPVKEGWD